MSKPKYWRGLEELEQSPEFLEQASKEFPTDIPMEDVLAKAKDEDYQFQANRRDFLKVMGFGIAATTLSGCFEAPTKKAIPYIVKPDYQIPSVANYYASTTPFGTPVIVKTREGRPIKLEGNPDSFISKGGLDAVGHASLLGLYDTDRLQAPKKGDNYTQWDRIDEEIGQSLSQIQAAGGKVRVLSHSLMSPSTRQLLGEFLTPFADSKHVQYDPISASAILDAHEATFGQRVLPTYHIENADVIVSFACDFLGTWLSPAEFTWKYATKRDPKDGTMSRHFQFETDLSLTGSNADLRFPIKPSQQAPAILNLYNKVASLLGKPVIAGVQDYNVAANALDKVANELVANRGKSLVLCGINDTSLQQLVNSLNHMLDNYGATLDIENSSFYAQGSDKDLVELKGELERGEVDALLIMGGANPVYDTPFAETFKKALPEMTLAVSFASKDDETNEFCAYTCPDSHYLESWGDAQQTSKHYSVIQPTVNPIFDTRQTQDTLLKWSASTDTYHTYLKNFWAENVIEAGEMPMQAAWDECLRMGFYEMGSSSESADVITSAPAIAEDAVIAAAENAVRSANNASGSGLELNLYQKVGLRDGQLANNPWLQELPDPISRVTWDNYVVVPVAYAKANGLKQEDVVKVTVPGIDKTVELPVLIQPGQANDTIGIAFGYGRTRGGKVITATGGADVFPFVKQQGENMSYSISGVTIAKTGASYKLAQTQTFNTLYDPVKGARSGEDYDRTEAIIHETVLPFYNGEAKGENPYKEDQEKWEDKRQHLITLWESHFEDPETSKVIRWAMAIDMNKCTGCGACVVACQTENNVPVVGKQEVLTRREMHWIRIDRYYSGSEENPDVVYQPMMCQHCDNAPCETVCPVLATIHSNEGLNQMTYNRCVGTRYCANNCPYKVRRFNWFSYYNDEQFTNVNPAQSDLGKLVLNPDVTVRYRGVMEKCSFCVQRLQELKLKAKINASSSYAKPDDTRYFTACQSSCPSGAIVFGDLNDKNSAVSKLYYDDRSYHVIEEVKTLPSVKYMTKVRNRTEEEYEQKEHEREEARTYNA